MTDEVGIPQVINFDLKLVLFEWRKKDSKSSRIGGSRKVIHGQMKHKMIYGKYLERLR